MPAGTQTEHVPCSKDNPSEKIDLNNPCCGVDKRNLTIFERGSVGMLLAIVVYADVYQPRKHLTNAREGTVYQTPS